MEEIEVGVWRRSVVVVITIYILRHIAFNGADKGRNGPVMDSISNLPWRVAIVLADASFRKLTFVAILLLLRIQIPY